MYDDIMYIKIELLINNLYVYAEGKTAIRTTGLPLKMAKFLWLINWKKLFYWKSFAVAS